SQHTHTHTLRSSSWVSGRLRGRLRMAAGAPGPDSTLEKDDLARNAQMRDLQRAVYAPAHGPVAWPGACPRRHTHTHRPLAMSSHAYVMHIGVDAIVCELVL